MHLLDGTDHNKEELLKKMESDEYYYGYLGKAALSSSSAKKLLESPYAYHLSLTQEQKPSSALREGRLLHMMVLEPHKAKELTIVSGTRAAKAYKEAIKEHGYENVFTSAEYNKCSHLAKKLHSLNDVVSILNDCYYEVPEIGYYNDLPFRGKADAISKDGFTIYDVKTTADIKSFASSCKSFSYDLQAALYLDLFDAFEFKFIVIDKSTMEVGIYDCSPEFIQSGHDKLNLATANYHRYLEDTTGFKQNIYYETL